MKKFISSKQTCTVLSINKPQLHTLVSFGVLKPKRIHTCLFNYDLEEVNSLLDVKVRVMEEKELWKR